MAFPLDGSAFCHLIRTGAGSEQQTAPSPLHAPKPLLRQLFAPGVKHYHR
jgi:hypothetical protein